MSVSCRTIVSTWVLFLVVAGEAGSLTGGEAGGGDRDAIGVAIQGYQANREAFPSIRCRFRATKAKARSIEEAIQGAFVGDPIVYECLWVVNGAKVRHEALCRSAPGNPEEVFSTTKNKATANQGSTDGVHAQATEVAVPCFSTGVLRNGSYALSYAPLGQTANLYPSDLEDPYGIRLTPFSMDIMGRDEMVNPARVLQDCLGGMFSGSFDGAEKVLGADTLAFTATYKSGNASSIGKPAYRFLLDPRRGYLPIHTWGTRPDTAKRAYEAYMTHVRACSRDRWFPERSVVIWDIGGKGPYTCQEIKVLELDVDNPPADQDLCADLKAGTQVNVRGRPEWLVLRADEKVMATALEPLHQRCIEAGKKHGEQAEFAKRAEPKPAPDNRLRWLVTAMVGCGLAAAVLWSVLRWRRPKAR